MVKSKLKIWNKEIFGNIGQNIKIAEEEVLKLQAIFDDTPTEANKRTLCRAQQILEDKLDVEENYWKQKANIKWIIEGDRNTKFFHNTVKKRRQKLHIFRMKDERGIWNKNMGPIRRVHYAGH